MRTKETIAIPAIRQAWVRRRRSNTMLHSETSMCACKILSNMWSARRYCFSSVNNDFKVSANRSHGSDEMGSSHGSPVRHKHDHLHLPYQLWAGIYLISQNQFRTRSILTAICCMLGGNPTCGRRAYLAWSCACWQPVTAQIALPTGGLGCAVAMTKLSVNMWPVIAAAKHLGGSGWKGAVQGEDGDYHVEPCTTHNSSHLYMAYNPHDLVRSSAVELVTGLCFELLIEGSSQLLFHTSWTKLKY